MKLVGVFDPCATFNTQNSEVTTPTSLYVIYQNNEEKYFIKYLDEGDLPLLLSKLESIKDKYLREKEVEKYLTQGINTKGYPHKYKPIRNEFYFEPFSLVENKDLTYYTSFQEFPKEKLHIESETEEDSQSYTIAAIFPKKDLYVGSHEFVYQNNLNNLNIEGKTSTEIKGIIEWLIENSYLDEAKEIIYKIKASKTSIDEYKHPKNLIVFDGSENFLDQQINRIETLEFVKEHTKHLKLKSFEK